MRKLKVLICGDFTLTNWHPIADVAGEMEDILSESCDVTFEEHFESYGAEGLARFDVCIFHIENYMDKEGTWPWVTNDIVTWMVNGGRLLLPHVPEILRSEQIAQMFGCRFQMHPPVCDLTFHVAGTPHPITEGVGDFTVPEERHQLILDPNTPRDVFLTVETPAGTAPAGWTTTFGLGKLVYLMPGHHAATYRSREYRKLFANAVRWLGDDTGADQKIASS